MIVSTKIEIPRLRPRLIPRTHLLRTMDAGFTGKMTIIAAPAGYGKTTLAVQWLQQRAAQAEQHEPAHRAWLSLGVEDNDPARFFAYLIAALQQIDASIGRGARAGLSTLQPPEPQAVMTHLINDVAELPSAIVLILDDYHVITEPAIHEALAFLVQQMPDKLHLMLLTRSTPPLSLARLRAQEQLVELDMDDLRLSAEEAAAFLRDVMALSLSSQAVQTLGMRTEGWIAGLQMAALSLRGRSDVDEFIANFSSEHRFISDFFNEEVLCREAEDIQHFLLRTSVLERLCPTLCEAALFGEEAAANPSFSRRKLQEIEQRNLFLLPLDDERNWYRYHPLFLDLLRAQASEQVSQTDIAELHRRAARWYVRHAQIGDAIYHLLEAGEEVDAAMLIESACEQFVHSDFSLMRGWLSRLPDAIVERSPRLTLFSAIMLLADDREEAAEARLDLAQTLLTTAPDYTEGPGVLAVLRGRLAFHRVEISEAMEHAQLALSLLPGSSSVWRTETRLLLATIYWVAGDLEAAEHQYREIHFTNRAAGDEQAALLATWKLGGLHHGMGELHQAQAYYQKVLARAGQPGLGVVCANAAHSLGLIYREWNRLQEARDLFQRGLTLSQPESRNRNWRAYTRMRLYAALAWVTHHQGDAMRAQDLLTIAEDIARKTDLPESEFVDLVEIYRTLFAIFEGNTEIVRSWLTTHGPEEADIGMIMVMTEQQKTRCQGWVRGLLALGPERAHEAASIARRLEPIFAGGGHARDAMYMRLAVVCAFQLMHKEGEALARLAPILHQGKREALVRMFVDWGAPMAALLKQAAANGIVPDYTAVLLNAFAADPWQGPGKGVNGSANALLNPALAEPLTPREQQILVLMAAGLSNAEIAQELVISVATVKRHITNLYAKLGVRRRSQALQRAWELKLIPVKPYT